MRNRFYAGLACTVVVTMVLVGCGAATEPPPTSAPPTEPPPTQPPPSDTPTPTELPPTDTPTPTQLPLTHTPTPTELPLTRLPTATATSTRALANPPLQGAKPPFQPPTAAVMRWGDQQQPILGEAPAWVSGERLVYKGCERANCGLYLTDSVYDGTGITQLTYDVTDTNPEVSPDGKKVAFMSRRDGNWEIYVMNTDGSDIKRLTDNGDTDGLPIWSPDGQTIAFASDRKGLGFSGDWAVWAMDPDGSNQRMLFSLGGSLHGYVQTQQKYKGGGWEEERLSWSP